MEKIYRRAGPADLEILVGTRLTVLRAIHGEKIDMTPHEPQIRCYYQRALADGSHVAYLVFEGQKLAGAGGMSIYQVMPSYRNPTGITACLMNIYTAPDFRRQGIAWHTLDLLVEEARSRGISAITLDAAAMGRPLYEKYGFLPMDGEMELTIR